MPDDIQIYQTNLTGPELDEALQKVAAGIALPTVTTADNGKYMRVVDGKWAAQSMDAYEEATFNG